MRQVLFILLALIPLFFPSSVSAHAFGQLYNLPVPFWMYVYGGAAVIIFSFVIIASFSTNTGHTYPVKNLHWLSQVISHKIFLASAKSFSVFLFLLTILTGLFGEDYSSVNFNMTFFWICFVLGFSYIVAISGNIWEVVSPLKLCIDWIERMSTKMVKGVYVYPKNLAYYPSLLFYILFISIELFGNTTPFSLSFLILLYTGITITGVIAWGKKNWLFYGEFFTVLFRLLSTMSVLSYTKNLFLRIPFTPLLSQKPAHISLVLFIIFMLSSTAYDGIHNTVSWVLVLSAFPQVFGSASYDIYQLLGLIIFLFLFFSMYLFCMILLQKITRTHQGLEKLSGSFVYSLIPIAIVYNVAHYYTLLITEGQNMIRLISDPFGYNWNVFGTAEHFEIYIPPANVVWHSQVLLIVIGHIIGVYLSHKIGLALFSTQKQVLLSQIPLLLLMVLYSMIGLWILSQPLTTG